VRHAARHGEQGQLCPNLGNDAQARACLFPSRLRLDVNATCGAFAMHARVFARAAILLPSGTGVWPEGVTVDGQPAAVVAMNDKPAVWLEPGERRLGGRLSWSKVPRFLDLDPNAALVELVRDGRVEPEPDIEAGGRLQLAQEAVREKQPEDRVDVAVYRLVRDGLPVTVATLVRLDVSGKARAIPLENVLPTDALPFQVRSPVAVDLGPGGGVTVQAGPGRWDVEIETRMPGPVAKLGPAAAPFGTEVWAFEALPRLRDVEVQGAPGVDPQTTDLPASWKRFPAFLVEPGTTIVFKELHRGEPGPLRDELQLFRAVWLDFDGKGLSVQDNIHGAMRQGKTLAMLPPGKLGRAVIGDTDQPIVLLGQGDLPGVIVRDQNLAMTAEARYEDFDGSLPAAGWDHDFQKVTTVLRLPPGWRLFTALGADGVDASWVSQWTLLDIFLTLLLTLAAFKLRGFWAGAALFLFLLLSYHEPGAPLTAWVFLLVFLALLRLFGLAKSPERWAPARRLALGGYAATVAGLVLLAIPFVINEIR